MVDTSSTYQMCADLFLSLLPEQLITVASSSCNRGMHALTATDFDCRAGKLYVLLSPLHSTREITGNFVHEDEFCEIWKDDLSTPAVRPLWLPRMQCGVPVTTGRPLIKPKIQLKKKKKKNYNNKFLKTLLFFPFFFYNYHLQSISCHKF